MRGGIDWKYALGLELEDSGFDHSVLSEFRTRLMSGKAEQRLLNQLLAHFKERGWVKERVKQRTDSTHVLSAIRGLNRLESVGEMLRGALNEIAELEPEWLQDWVPQDWYQRYGKSIEEYNLPKNKSEPTAYGEQVGADGMELLERLWREDTPRNLRQLVMVERLRQHRVHHFYLDQGLAEKSLLPSQHFVDAGYVDVELLVTSQEDYGIELIGPVRPDPSWQAKQPEAYDCSHFSIDSKGKKVTCPAGHQSKSWTTLGTTQLSP